MMSVLYEILGENGVDKKVDNRRIYIVSVRPRAYLREQKASLALPFVPVGTGTPEFSVLSEALSKIKKKLSMGGRI